MLIGLHGYPSSGKDSTFEAIQEWARAHERSVRRSAFADLVKFSALRSVGFEGSLEQCVEMGNRLKQPGFEVIVREPQGTEHAISGREFIQFFGDEGHRQVFGEDFWIDAVLSNHRSSEVFVITDVRYENEAEAVIERGGEIWKLVRPNTHKLGHTSEQGLPDHMITRLISNDGNLHHLRDKAFEALEDVETKWLSKV